ncbi:DnaJ domain containing protein [Zostera marina]|uniref:DnaJ domain containing protein n=1 Tax=Zostera marina TaxID=29655 RepID=A0A0K9PCD9_ZOSMR|nr:DnaJ domain containing protein [Zostera marina]
MRGEEARELLGFPLRSHITSSQVKEAYLKKALETHPDRFPTLEKSAAESKFKLVSEAYACLQNGPGYERSSDEAIRVRVVRKGVSTANGMSRTLIKIPFFLIIFTTISLGGLNVRRQKDENPSISRNPFLP